ncbi:ribosomal protein S18-alanine N-acetyltransferase [bacterium]|nr:ribosomal protein S18-alanine N-acetyltransferase [bacterium]
MDIILLKERRELIPSAIDKELKYSKYEYISSNNNLNYVFILDDEIIGEVDYSYPLDTVDLLYIYIDSGKRGNGYGKNLLNATIEKLKKLNVKEIVLEVRKDNTVAYNLYKKVGFNEIGIRKNYYDGITDAILMKLIIG